MLNSEEQCCQYGLDAICSDRGRCLTHCVDRVATFHPHRARATVFQLAFCTQFAWATGDACCCQRTSWATAATPAMSMTFPSTWFGLVNQNRTGSLRERWCLHGFGLTIGWSKLSCVCVCVCACVCVCVCVCVCKMVWSGLARFRPLPGPTIAGRWRVLGSSVRWVLWGARQRCSVATGGVLGTCLVSHAWPVGLQFRHRVFLWYGELRLQLNTLPLSLEFLIFVERSIKNKTRKAETP